MWTLSDKVTPATDFKDDGTVVLCECGVPVVNITFAGDGAIQMITDIF